MNGRCLQQGDKEVRAEVSEVPEKVVEVDEGVVV